MTSPPPSHSGLIDIRGVTWRWTTLDPEIEPPAHTDEEALFIAFRTPVDPRREMRCVLEDPDDLPPSEEQLRRLFRQAWAVKL